MTIGIIYASTPDELLCTNKYRYKAVMVPIDFDDSDRPILRYFPDMGMSNISQLVGATDIILQVEESDPNMIENLCLEAFAYKIASSSKDVLQQVHLECSSISLGLIETSGYCYIEPEDTYIEFLILNRQLTDQKRVSACKAMYSHIDLMIGEICTKKDAELAMFWKLNGAVTQKPELLEYLEQLRY